MGVRLKFAALFIAVVVVLVGLVVLLNITFFCQEQTEIDFKLFKIGCNVVPNKAAELDGAINRTCYIFQTRYNCDMDQINSVTAPYTEFGKEQRTYTLVELCQLRNQFYVPQQCATSCGCKA